MRHVDIEQFLARCSFGGLHASDVSMLRNLVFRVVDVFEDEEEVV